MAAERKAQANGFFAAKEYQQCIPLYTEAIAITISGEEVDETALGALHSNRYASLVAMLLHSLDFPCVGPTAPGE